MRRLLSLALALPLVLAAALAGQAPASAAPPAGHDWRTVAVGAGHSCGIRAAGTLWCWGSDGHDELGNGPGRTDEPYPTRIGTASDWTRVALAGDTACGLRSTLLFCWGEGGLGTVGVGPSRTLVPEPAQVQAVRWTSPGGFRFVRWTSVSPGGWRTCATGWAGEGLWCWGLGTDGMLGDGGTEDRYSPTRVAEGSWRSVSTGHFHTCAIEGVGALWCWGSNRYGQVGDGTTTARPRPVRVGSRTDWASVSAGGYFTCALTTSGERWCWGSNDRGQFGDGSTTGRTVPTAVAGQPWSNVSAGAYSACGTTSGGAYCWGANASIRLFPGAPVRYLYPKRIGSGSAVWADLQVGRGYNTGAACGRQTDGSAWCFSDIGPQLGSGSVDGYAGGAAPVQVLG